MTERRQFCPRGHDTFLVGRDSSYRCLQCKRESMADARQARLDEEWAIRAAERAAIRAAEEKLREAERARIIAAGGLVARELRWNERWVRTLQTTETSLCQWPQPNNRPGGCFQRTTDGDVYCDRHNDQLDAEQAEYRRISAVAEPKER